jgi:hypothetical protein
VAATLSGLAVSDIGGHTLQQLFAMLESELCVNLTLLTGHFACFGDDWDGALRWVLFAFVDGRTWDNLLMEVSIVRPLGRTSSMNMTYVSVRAILGVDQNSGVTPVICTREFLTRRSGGPRSSNLHL